MYLAVVYHDSEENANERDEYVGYFPSLQSATEAINAKRDDYWQTGSIHYGFLFPAVLGVRPERWEDDERETPWFVGTDGKADR